MRSTTSWRAEIDGKRLSGMIEIGRSFWAISLKAQSARLGPSVKISEAWVFSRGYPVNARFQDIEIIAIEVRTSQAGLHATSDIPIVDRVIIAADSSEQGRIDENGCIEQTGYSWNAQSLILSRNRTRHVVEIVRGNYFSGRRTEETECRKMRLASSVTFRRQDSHQRSAHYSSSICRARHRRR